MLGTFKVLALIIYNDERKVVTNNMVRAKNKEEAKKKIEKKYMKNPGACEIIIEEERDIIRLI